jgi:hypothetical protein
MCFASWPAIVLIRSMDFPFHLASICSDQFNFVAARSNAVLALIKIGAVWDAQILVHPIIESTVKTSFICFSPREQRADLCREYEETETFRNPAVA